MDSRFRGNDEVRGTVNEISECQRNLVLAAEGGYTEVMRCPEPR